MNKAEILENFNKLHGIEDKEKFMKANGIQFTYDSFYNLIIFADDGRFELKPHEWKRKHYGQI